jgi:CubicO group peptidase (beta-lactamase class C family)
MMTWVNFLLLVLLFHTVTSQTFPGNEWKSFTNEEILKKGWNLEKLERLKQFKLSIETQAMMIIQDGKIIFEHGKTNQKFISKSVRKSLLSTIISLEVEKGNINLESTLKEINFDDNEPKLTELEKSAKIKHLLSSVSGIYHDAIYEMSLPEKPDRNTKQPGEYFLYNNWDYNALGSIFERVTNQSIYKYFNEQISQKIGMQDFKGKEISSLREDVSDKYPPFTKEGDGFYVYGDKSLHKAYLFLISARDLARVGWLYLNYGNWNGTQIIPRNWVEKISSYDHKNFEYMFWTDNWFNKYFEAPKGIYSALGDGCQTIFMIPQWNIVFVHMTDTAKPHFNNTEFNVAWDEFGCLLGMVLNSYHPLKIKNNEFCRKWLVDESSGEKSSLNVEFVISFVILLFSLLFNFVSIFVFIVFLFQKLKSRREPYQEIQ